MFGGGEEFGGYYVNWLFKYFCFFRYCFDFVYRFWFVMFFVVINGLNSVICNFYILLLCVELNLKFKMVSFVKYQGQLWGMYIGLNQFGLLWIMGFDVYLLVFVLFGYCLNFFINRILNIVF